MVAGGSDPQRGWETVAESSAPSRAFAGLYKLGNGNVTGILGYCIRFMDYFAVLNIGLGTFNLIPVPPLDGSKVLAVLLPERIYFKLMKYERYGGILMVILLYTGILSEPLGTVRNWIFDGMLSVWL